MKNKFQFNRYTLAFASLLLAVVLSGCDSSTNQIQKVKKPAIVFSKHKSTAWYETPMMILKDADGKLVELVSDDALRTYIDKYNVGDTLR